MQQVERFLHSKYCYAFFFLCIYLLVAYSPLSGTMEADTYFHLAISKISSEEGLIRHLPQFEELGWSSYFPDKEFLFHQLTRLGYLIAGDRGVLISAYLLSSLTIVLLAIVCESVSNRKTAIVITLIMLLDLNFFFRMTLVRPHLAGIFFSLLLLLGLIKKDRRIIVAATLLFPLFYHAIYVPLGILGSFLVCSKEHRLGYLFKYGIIPMILGLIVNPYFPSTLTMSWLGASIAFSASHTIEVGQEAKPLGAIDSIAFIGPFITLSLPLVYFWKDLYRKSSPILPLLLLVLTFQTLYFISPRSIEYLIPFFTVLAAATISHFQPRAPYFFIMASLAIFAINSRNVGKLVFSKNNFRAITDEILRLASKLPTEGSEKVFNCEWDNGAHIFYLRPNLRVVEILDPNFIYLQNESIGKTKANLHHLTGDKIYEALTQLFEADYLFCKSGVIVEKIKEDPRFDLISTSKTIPSIFLYKIRKNVP